MYWQKYPSRSEDPLSRENLETAIRLYASSTSLYEEEKWLGVIENVLRTGFVFTEQDFCDDARGERKKHHQVTLSRFKEQTRLRRSGEISRSELAQELRDICNLPAENKNRSGSWPDPKGSSGSFSSGQG